MTAGDVITSPSKPACVALGTLRISVGGPWRLRCLGPGLVTCWPLRARISVWGGRCESPAPWLLAAAPAPAARFILIVASAVFPLGVQFVPPHSSLTVSLQRALAV